MVVIVSGSISRGFDICGPFKDEEEAHKFAKSQFFNRDYYNVVPLINPKDA